MFDNIIRIIWAILTASFVGLIVHFRKPLKSILHALGDMETLKVGPLEFKRRIAILNQHIMAPEERIGSSDTVQAIQSSETQSFGFKISNLAIFPLLCMYCLVKSFRCRRGFYIHDVLLKMYPHLKERTVEFGDLVIYASALFEVFEAPLGVKIRALPGTSSVQIRNMSTKTCDSVEKELDRRINEPSFDPQYQAMTLDMKKTIDDYFSFPEVL